MHLKSTKKACLIFSVIILSNFASADMFDQSLSEIFQSNLLRSDDPVLATPSTGLAAWIDNPQARLSFDESNGDGIDTSYRLRFNPILRKEQRAQKTISKLRQDRQTRGREQRLLAEIKVVYESVVDIVRSELEQKNLAEQKKLLDLSAQYHQSLAQTDEFDPERLQEVNFEIARIEKAKEINEIRSRQLTLSMNSSAKNVERQDEVDLGTDAIVSPDEIWSLVQQHKSDWFEKTMSRQSAVDALTTRILHEEVGLSKAQSDFGFNLMEFELNNDSSGNSIGVTFGFRLPNIGSNRELIRRQLNLAEGNDEYATREYVNVKTISELTDSLELNFNEWSAYNELLSRYDADFGAADATNAELILTQSEERLLLSQRAATSYGNLLRAYVELISFSGVIGETPLRNWLKTGQPVVAGL